MIPLVLFLGGIALASAAKGVPLNAMVGESSLLFLLSGFIFSASILGPKRIVSALRGTDRSAAQFTSQVVAGFLTIAAFMGFFLSLNAQSESEFKIVIFNAVGIPILYASLAYLYLMSVNKLAPMSLKQDTPPE